jgi:hypothetical protein
MSRKRIESRIQSLEKKQQQDKSRGVIFADKAPDGTLIDPDTGDPIEDSEKTPRVVFYIEDGEWDAER